MAANARVYKQFGAAFVDLYPVASRCATRFFGPRGRALAEAATTETLARAFDHWEHVRRGHEAPGWVVLTCKDVCLELLHEEAADGARALDLLTRRARDVFVLRYMFGLSEAETARVLGWKPAKVTAVALEARNAMRLLLTNIVDLPALEAEETPVHRVDTETYIKRMNVR